MVTDVLPGGDCFDKPPCESTTDPLILSLLLLWEGRTCFIYKNILGRAFHRKDPHSAYKPTQIPARNTFENMTDCAFLSSPPPNTMRLLVVLSFSIPYLTVTPWY